eukprot:m.292167 g.292167  ORF g.292167 m.292167 type:complete len:614 (+) comp55109_c0_seq6:65-1906(+)
MSSFLAHDMTPVDPRSLSPRVSPVPGNPRFKGFPTAAMETSRSAPVALAETPRHVLHGTLNPTSTPVAQPGSPSEFFSGGLHSSGLSKSFGSSKPSDFERNTSEQRQTKQVEYRETLAEQVRSKQELDASSRRQHVESPKPYDPWGKPGAGAPRDTTALVSGDVTLAQQVKAGPLGYSGRVFGQPGAGAPLRTQSGKVKASMSADPQVQIQNLYRSNPNLDRDYNHGRTVDPNYAHDLGQQLADASVIRRTKSAERLPVDTAYNPFGRSGGGAPIKTDGHLQAQRTRKLEDSLTTQTHAPLEQQPGYVQTLKQQMADKESLQSTLTQQDRPSSYDPWGKGLGQPQRLPDGSVQPRSKTLEVPSDTALGQSLVETLGQTRMARSLSDPPPFTADAYHPYGRPGAGAPIRDTEGNTNTRVAGVAELEVSGRVHERELVSKVAKEAYLSDLKQEMAAKSKANEDMSAQQRVGDDPSAFYKFGQGAANPKRDPDSGALVGQPRTRTDVITYREDALGARNSPDPVKQALNVELAKQTSQKVWWFNLSLVWLRLKTRYLYCSNPRRRRMLRFVSESLLSSKSTRKTMGAGRAKVWGLHAATITARFMAIVPALKRSCT